MKVSFCGGKEKCCSSNAFRKKKNKTIWLANREENLKDDDEGDRFSLFGWELRFLFCDNRSRNAKCVNWKICLEHFCAIMLLTSSNSAGNWAVNFHANFFIIV